MAPKWSYTLHAFDTRFSVYALRGIIIFIVIIKALLQAVLNTNVY